MSHDNAWSRQHTFWHNDVWHRQQKRLLDLYESGVQSATILCDKTNIPTFNVYDNCKNFCEGKSELRCSGSRRNTIFDLNNNKLLMNVREEDHLESKWTISQTQPEVNILIIIQNILLMTNEHDEKETTDASSIMTKMFIWYLWMKMASSFTNVHEKGGLNRDNVRKWSQNSHQQLQYREA